MSRRIRSGILAGLCLTAFAVAAPAPSAEASGGLILAQAAPPPTVLPPNVKKPSRLYVVEGIVIVLLFAGALFAVCRSSGRS